MPENELDPRGAKPGQQKCGLYRTTSPISGKVPAEALVYYHNHGDPGPGVYPVERWLQNKAVFSKRGVTVTEDGWERTLVSLPEEGFYRVTEAFTCCEKQCRSFDPDLLVQLGYNGKAEPLLFVPVWSYEGISLPSRGTKISADRLEKLERVKVSERFEPTGPDSAELDDQDDRLLH